MPDVNEIIFFGPIPAENYNVDRKKIHIFKNKKPTNVKNHSRKYSCCYGWKESSISNKLSPDLLQSMNNFYYGEIDLNEFENTPTNTAMNGTDDTWTTYEQLTARSGGCGLTPDMLNKANIHRWSSPKYMFKKVKFAERLNKVLTSDKDKYTKNEFYADLRKHGTEFEQWLSTPDGLERKKHFLDSRDENNLTKNDADNIISLLFASYQQSTKPREQLQSSNRASVNPFPPLGQNTNKSLKDKIQKVIKWLNNEDHHVKKEDGTYYIQLCIQALNPFGDYESDPLYKKLSEKNFDHNSMITGCVAWLNGQAETAPEVNPALAKILNREKAVESGRTMHRTIVDILKLHLNL